MKIPCNECLKAPICKHKTYAELMAGCNDFRYELYVRGKVDRDMRAPGFDEMIQEAVCCLKPTQWEIETRLYVKSTDMKIKGKGNGFM